MSSGGGYVNYVMSNDNQNVTITATNQSGTKTYGIALNEYGMPLSNTTSNANITYGYTAGLPQSPSSINQNGFLTTNTFNSVGLIESTTTGSLSSFYEWDSNNFLKKIIDANGNVTEIVRDANGNPTTIKEPLSSNTSIAYNSWGLPTQITDPEGIIINISYNNAGNILSVNAPLSINMSLTYDAGSRVIASNINGRIAQLAYDNIDNIKQVTDPMNFITQFAFDDNDNLNSITNAKGKTTSLTYNNQGLPTSVSFGGRTETYTYYADGTPKDYTQPSGDKFAITYDGDGRIIDDGYTTVTYDDCDCETKNLIKTLSNAEHGTLTQNYDTYRRLVDYTDAYNQTLGYVWDNNGNKTKIIFPDGKEQINVFDAKNRGTSVSFDGNSIATYSYRKDNKINSVILGNGVVMNLGYDLAGRMNAMTTSKSNGEVISSYALTLDTDGNITDLNLNEPYQFLRIKRDSSLTYTYNDRNEILSVSDGTNYLNFTHDLDGNQIAKGSTNISYNSSDYVTGISSSDFTASYTYGPDKALRKAIRNGAESRYVIDITGMPKIVVEMDGSNNVRHYYIYAPNGMGLLARVEASGDIHYYHYNFQGSTIAMTDEVENITHKYQYNFYGNMIQSEEQDSNLFTYIGKYGVMKEGQFYFMRARFYDPETGRFVSQDPIWSTNLYPYANNNPLMFVDPMGESAIHIAPVVYKAVKAIVDIAFIYFVLTKPDIRDVTFTKATPSQYQFAKMAATTTGNPNKCFDDLNKERIKEIIALIK
jgi:RHS repeat-associated protein